MSLVNSNLGSLAYSSSSSSSSSSSQLGGLLLRITYLPTYIRLRRTYEVTNKLAGGEARRAAGLAQLPACGAIGNQKAKMIRHILLSNPSPLPPRAGLTSASPCSPRSDKSGIQTDGLLDSRNPDSPGASNASAEPGPFQSRELRGASSSSCRVRASDTLTRPFGVLEH